MKPRLPFAAYGVVPSIPTSWNVAGRVSDCSPFGAARVLPCRVEGRPCRKARPSAAPPHRSERSRIESVPTEPRSKGVPPPFGPHNQASAWHVPLPVLLGPSLEAVALDGFPVAG